MNEPAELAIYRLSMKDIPSIMEVETRSFVPGARVSEPCMRNRLELGHVMLGLRADRKLVGIIAFLLSDFDPRDRRRFPKTQSELSSQPTQEGANTGFIYNLAIAPGHRRLVRARMLYRAAANQIVQSGCTYTLGAVRVPSYRGSEGGDAECIAHSSELAAAIDRYHAGGRFPDHEEFCRDPLLAFHHRMTTGSFLWIIREFEPNDEASGRMGVVLYTKSTRMLEHLSPGV